MLGFIFSSITGWILTSAFAIFGFAVEIAFSNDSIAAGCNANSIGDCSRASFISETFQQSLAVSVGLGGDDIINGASGSDTIDGGPGDDTINGGSGDDSIDGGDGIDDVDGLWQTDTCDDAETATRCETITENGEEDT